MPFTPTHVLAILPIAAMKRLRLPFSALAIGSMIPDFPLFVHFGPSYQTTHSIPGLFSACLPLGLTALVLMRFVLAEPLMALLPPGPRRRFESHFERRGPMTGRSVALASVAIVIGAATHALWDSFTHEDRWGTRTVPALNAVGLTIGGHPVRRFHLLQYGCSALGLPLLGAILYDRFRKLPEMPEMRQPETIDTRSRFLIVAALAVIALAAGAYGWFRFDRPVPARLHEAITKAGLALMIGTLAYCIAWWWRFRKADQYRSYRR